MCECVQGSCVFVQLLGMVAAQELTAGLEGLQQLTSCWLLVPGPLCNVFTYLHHALVSYNSACSGFPSELDRILRADSLDVPIESGDELFKKFFPIHFISIQLSPLAHSDA